MAPLLARGELPTLAGLRERGAFGPLATIRPTFSPAIWNSMVTGRSPKRHGIEGFTSRRFAGVAGALGRTEAPRALGFARLLRYLEESGRIADGPVVSSARKVPAFWEIATAHGSPVSVVNFWATWPAEPVLGALVSERVHYWRQAGRGDRPEEGQLTYPRELHAEIRPLVLSPDEVTWEDSRPFMDVSAAEFEAMRRTSVNEKTIGGEFKYLYSMFETERRVALHLVERSRREWGRPADLLVLFRIVDIACHRSLGESELVTDHLGASGEDVRRFGRVVSESYRRVDRALGEILGAVGEANVVVVSDHGFRRETQDGKPVYQHRTAPPGVFLAAGPAIRPGPVEGLDIYSVMPLLASLKRLPVADDLEGRLREDVLDPAFLAKNPVVRVASYGRRGAITVAREASGADQEMLERLRALGYVQ
jgi:Type I phosphodiesterase / nucleotide pyrophosphatase